MCASCIPMPQNLRPCAGRAKSFAAIDYQAPFQVPVFPFGRVFVLRACLPRDALSNQLKCHLELIRADEAGMLTRLRQRWNSSGVKPRRSATSSSVSAIASPYPMWIVRAEVGSFTCLRHVGGNKLARSYAAEQMRIVQSGSVREDLLRAA